MLTNEPPARPVPDRGSVALAARADAASVARCGSRLPLEPFRRIVAVMKALMPTVDAGSQLREAAFALLLRDQQPVTASTLVALTGLSPESTRRSIRTLADAGWLDLDIDGRVAGAAGLSLVKGPHRLTVAGAPFRTWCAYDALGIPAALGRDAELTTTCGQCERDVRLQFHDGRPDRAGPELLWLAEGGADLRGSFCSPTVLLCGPDHGHAWGEAQGGHGELLDLETASRRGGSDWAGCAAASAALR